MNNTVMMDVITLENGKEYYILDEVMYKDWIFNFLLEKENKENILVRKKIIEENKEFLEEIRNIDELQLAFSLFFKKHPELLKEESQNE